MMQEQQIQPDEVLYNSLLDGCCKSNQLDLGLKVYKSMREQNIKPSNVTVSLILMSVVQYFG